MNGASTNSQINFQNTTRSSQPGSKILRACVVQDGKVIEEQRLPKGGSLTIGNGPKNTFVISDPTLPKSHSLFLAKGSQYELVLTNSMAGRISIDNQTLDIVTLKEKGLLKKQGDLFSLALNENHRGKIVIGNITVIFQFVMPPPKAATPKLPASARGTIWTRVDWPFMGILLAVIAFETPIGIVVALTPPKKEKMTLEDMGDRWAKLIVPDRKKVEKQVEDSKTKSAGAEQKKETKKSGASDDIKDGADRAKARAVRTEKIRKSIEGRGILAILGTSGEGSSSGAVADVFGSGGIGGDLDSAFDGISGVGIATGSGQRSTRGGGTGDAASIGGLATAGGGKVGLGGKRETRLASVDTAAPEVDGALDSEAIARVVRARKRMVQDCYERELKRDPNLAGKIEIEFTIDSSGRVIEARISNNKMGSTAVGECIVSRIKSWRFPKPDGGNVTVNFPFIFTSSS